MELRTHYKQDRLVQIDPDFLEFEENQITVRDQELLAKALTKNISFDTNPHNSILLYLLGLTDQFDHDKARSDTIGGAPPDIDSDFDALDKYKAMQWAKDYYGDDHVAHIGTYPVFKPKGIIESWYRTHGLPRSDGEAVKKHVPDGQYGQAASLEDIIEAYPRFKTQYPDLYRDAKFLEGMVSKAGIHAAGVVISDNPIDDVVPTYIKEDTVNKYVKTKIKKRITAMDMHDVEELGVIKVDYLSLENLSILKECCRLVNQEHGITITEADMYKIPDGDERAYKLMHAGFLTGIFQMEASPGVVRDLMSRTTPTSIEELGDLTSLNRPGPIDAGLLDEYIDNKNAGYQLSNQPEAINEILKDTNWTLVYQEQMMQIVSEIAGFNLEEADTVRRALGKKKMSVLQSVKPKFIAGSIKAGITPEYAEHFWENVLIGFANYCLAGDTVVETFEGPRKIEDLVSRAESIWVPCLGDSGPAAAPVTQFHDQGMQQVNTYTFSDGSEVTCTPDHQFLTTEGKYYTISLILAEGMELADVDGVM